MNDPRHADARVAPFAMAMSDEEFRGELRRCSAAARLSA